MYLLITMTLSFDLQLISRIFLNYIVPVYFAKNRSLLLVQRREGMTHCVFSN